jgi:hypothetical protein
MKTFLTLAFAFSVLNIAFHSPTASAEPDLRCPQDAAAWRDQIDEWAEDPPYDISIIPTCASTAPPGIQLCLRNLVNFSHAYGIARGTGSAEDQSAMLSQMQDLTTSFPQLVETPKAFLGLTKVSQLVALRDQCKIDKSGPKCKNIENWEILPMTSEIFGGGGQPRVYAMAPNHGFDQWFAFFPGASSSIHSRDIIVVQYLDLKTDERLAQPRTYFFSEQGMGPKPSPSACIRCHSNGPRFIVPTPGSAAVEDSQASIRHMNARLIKYGKNDFSPYFDITHLGPPMGTNYSCTACHNNNDRSVDEKSRDPLTAALEPAIIQSMMDHRFMMPPDLRRTELKAYFGALIKIRQLSPEDQKTVLSYFTSVPPEPVGSSTDAFVYQRSGLREAQRKTVQFLADKKQISTKDLEQALAAIAKYDAIRLKDFKGLMSDHQHELAEWLKTGADGCTLTRAPAGKIRKKKKKPARIELPHKDLPRSVHAQSPK